MSGLLFALVFGACHHTPDSVVTLADLSASRDEAAAGRRLMAGTPPGMSRLDGGSDPRTEAWIAVHGYGSRGSEWVAPLEELGETGAEVWFYHWQTKQCPATAAADLTAAVTGLLTAEPQLERVTVVGHSYGGLISTLMAQSEQTGRAMQVEIVAAPLTDHPRLEKLCGFSGATTDPAAEGVTWRQWRTVQASDGAFEDLDTDPQLLDLPGLTVEQLPAEWEGGRLGHNRSITYVAQQLTPEAASSEQEGDAAAK